MPDPAHSEIGKNNAPCFLQVLSLRFRVLHSPLPQSRRQACFGLSLPGLAMLVLFFPLVGLLDALRKKAAEMHVRKSCLRIGFLQNNGRS